MTSGLPPAHLDLWARHRLVVQLAVTHEWLRSVRLHDLVVVLASAGTTTARVVLRFFSASVVEAGDDGVVAILVDEAMWRFARDVNVMRYLPTIPPDALALVTAPVGCVPGISTVVVKPPQRNRVNIVWTASGGPIRVP